MASIFLVALVTFAVLAFLALGAVITAWKHIEHLYEDWWAKAAVEAAQVATAAVAVGLSFASINQKDDWLPPTVAGWIAVALLKATQLTADARAKRSLQDREAQVHQLRERAERAEAEGTFRTQLLSTLREPVKLKRRRLEREVESIILKQIPASIKHVRNALRPKEHLEGILCDLVVLLREQLPLAERAHRSFRAGLYIVQGGVMRPVHGVSSSDPSYNPFSSHRSHEQHFRLDASYRPAHTVRCVRDHSMIIVPDCEKAQRDGTLFFFHERQPTYLKSMVACYIGEVCGPDGTKSEAALVIDTDVVRYFRQEDEVSLRFLIEEFSARLALELSLVALVSQRKRTSYDDALHPRGTGKTSEAARSPEEITPPRDET